MTRRALAFALAAALFGCVFGSRPGLPNRDDSGLGGTVNFSDAADPTRNVDAGAPPPSADAAVDVGARSDAAETSRDVADASRDGGCPVGDVPDGGDAPDAADAPDGGDAEPPCNAAAARPELGVEASP